MLAFAQRAQRHLAGRMRADLDTDEQFQDALLRCLSVIGEAAFKTSAAMRNENPTVPWLAIAGFRHVLVHDYGVVNLDRVWVIAHDHLRRSSPICNHCSRLNRRLVLEPSEACYDHDDHGGNQEFALVLKAR